MSARSGGIAFKAIVSTAALAACSDGLTAPEPPRTDARTTEGVNALLSTTDLAFPSSRRWDAQRTPYVCYSASLNGGGETPTYRHRRFWLRLPANLTSEPRPLTTYTLTALTEDGRHWGTMNCAIPDDPRAVAFVNKIMGVGTRFPIRGNPPGRASIDLPPEPVGPTAVAKGEVGPPSMAALRREDEPRVDPASTVCSGGVCYIEGITVTVPPNYGGTLYPDFAYSPSYIPDSGSDYDSYDPNPCDPVQQPDCLKPLSPEDVDAIREASNYLRKEFTDQEAAEACSAMANKFDSMMESGNVFRGNTDDPVIQAGTHHSGTHDGAYYGGNIHFDPSFITSMHNGSPDQLRNLLNLMLHEAAHALNFDHGEGVQGLWGYPLYSEHPFDKLSPGSNSCIQ